MSVGMYMDSHKRNVNRDGYPPLRSDSYLQTYGSEHNWESGHLYIVKPYQDREIYKLGRTTHIEKRMYWYEPGVELMYCVLVHEHLNLIEKMWIHKIKTDDRFTIVQGYEYFTGPYEEAIKILGDVRNFVNSKKTD